MPITRPPASPSVRVRTIVSDPGRRAWRWTAWAVASLAAHAAVLVAVSSSTSPTPTVTGRGPVLISVQWEPPVPKPSVPKAGSAPAAPDRTRRAADRQGTAATEDHRAAPPPVPAKSARHAHPAPSRARPAEDMPSHAVTAPDHAAPPSSQRAGARSRRNLDLVRRHLERFKFYPESARRRGIGGDVGVGFRLTAGGHVAQVRITASSGYALLDRAAEAIVARAVPFPVDRGQYRVRLRFWP